MRRRSREEDEENPDRWVISYADFVTLLFAFFTTMYAISQVDGGKLARFTGSMRTAFRSTGAAAPPPVIEGVRPVPRDLAAAAAEMKKTLEGLASSGEISVTVDEKGVVVSLGDRILFEPGQAALRETAAPIMSVVAGVIRGLPNEVAIEGHTDNVPLGGKGRYQTNWDLSTARATSVLRQFVTDYGIAPSRLSAAGYAEYRPVSSNETPEGRARNRRVSIVLLPSPLQ